MCPKKTEKKSKQSKKKSGLPPVADKRLRPYIERGLASGIFSDETAVVELWKKTAKQPDLQDTISQLGGVKTEVAQGFITDAVLIDLTAILRQKRYSAHMELWEVNHRSFAKGDGTSRAACFLMGQAVIEDGGSVMEPAIFRMALWENDVALADDLERGSTYLASVGCRDLDDEILDLKSLGGLTSFKAEDYEHGSSADLLKDMYEITPIAELADDLSRGPQDFRLIEATVSYSGMKTARSGNQFGSMLLKDDSTMTMEALESGENLLLSAITSLDIVSEFGKYSKILALVRTSNSDQYGMSANIETAIGIVTVAPPQVEVATKDEDDDDAADYFKTEDSDLPVLGDDDDDDDDDDDSEPASQEDDEDEEEVIEANEESEEADPESDPGSEASDDDDDDADDDDDDDDDWDDWD